MLALPEGRATLPSLRMGMPEQNVKLDPTPEPEQVDADSYRGTSMNQISLVVATSPRARGDAARRGKLLSRVTLAYNTVEGIAATATGILAGSIALIGFGIDSVIEVVSSVASLFRLHRDADEPLRLPLGHRPGLFVTEHDARVVVGGPGCGSRHGADHREGRGGGRARRDAVRRLLLRKPAFLRLPE